MSQNSSRISGALECSGDLTVGGGITGGTGLTLTPLGANPGGANTIWINSGDGNSLYKGSSAIGSAGITGPGSSTVNGVALWDNITGTTLKSSTAEVVLDYNPGGPSTNIAIGYNNLKVLTTGLDNIAFGLDAGANITTGRGNMGCGFGSLYTLTEGWNNTALGNSTLVNLLNGDGNIALGRLAGSAYTGNESYNICIGENVLGTAGESQTIRIGSTHTSAYLAGVYNNLTYTGGRMPVYVDSVGKLHSGSSTSYAQLNYMNLTGTSFNLTVGSTFSAVPSTATFSTNNNSLFSKVGSGITYSGASATTIKMDVSLSGFISTTAQLNFLLRNDPATTALAQNRQTFTTGEFTNITFSVIRSLTNGQTLLAYVETNINTTLTITAFNMNLTTI